MNSWAIFGSPRGHSDVGLAGLDVDSTDQGASSGCSLRWFVVGPPHASPGGEGVDGGLKSRIWHLQPAYPCNPRSAQIRPSQAQSNRIRHKDASSTLPRCLRWTLLPPRGGEGPGKGGPSVISPSSELPSRIKPRPSEIEPDQIRSSRGGLARARSRWIVLDQARSSQRTGGRGVALNVELNVQFPHLTLAPA